MKTKQIDCHELNGRMFVEVAPIAELLREQAKRLTQAAEDLERGPSEEKLAKKKAAPASERKPRTSTKKLLTACELAIADAGRPLRSSAIIEALAAAMPAIHVRQKSVDRALAAAGYVCGIDGWAKPAVQQ